MHLYMQAAKQWIIHAKCRKFSEFRTSEICRLFRHHTANIGVAVAGSAVPVLLSLYNMCGYVY